MIVILKYTKKNLTVLVRF